MDKVVEFSVKAIFIIAFAGLVGILLAFPLMWCWNYVMPYLFELKEITWGQAWCLNIISNMLIQSTLSHNSSS